MFRVGEDTKCKILKLFNKDVNDLKQDVGIIKEWLKTQTHLPEVPTDRMLEYFIVNNKFSLERTKQKINSYYIVRNLIHEKLGNINPKQKWIKEGYMSQFVFMLPKLRDDIHRIICVRFKPTPTEQFKTEFAIGNLINLNEIRMHEDFIFADIVIIDFENFLLGHCMKVTPTHLSVFHTILEKIYSYRVKEIHVINQPPAFDALMKLAKMFMKQKVLDRMIIHDSLESMKKHFPDECLPEEYGGTEKSFKKLEEILKKKIEEYGERFDKLEKFKVDETQLPVPLRNIGNNGEFGVEGSFKKLNID